MERHPAVAAHRPGRAPRQRRLRRAALGAAVLSVALVAPAESVNLPERTFLGSSGPNNAPAQGASTRPSLSAAGVIMAFDSVATNIAVDPNGAVRDVFSRDVVSDSTRLVSQAPGGQPADGPSSHAAVGGRLVAFQSEATNLVAGDANGTTDVFARTGDDPVVLISARPDGNSGNGASRDADVTNDADHVAFVSAASDLVPGDTNGHPDVFVRDVQTGRTQLVSKGTSGPANGPSSAPAISANGRYVTFASSATNLVSGDTNGIQDVFLADLRTGRVERVSVRGARGQQNRSVIEPFSQISDVSRDGRYVVFDSDATNLVPGDRNRDTDVFLRDRKEGFTTRVSIDQFGFEADNDSFNPTISQNGRFIAFQSFASRLAPGDGPREDIFVYDRYTVAPSVISVGARGERREAERVRQLLQRPSISSDGQVVAFSSTARNLVRGDSNNGEDVFLRVTAPPRVRIVSGPRGTVSTDRPRLVLSSDDRRAREFICAVDTVRFRCGRRSRLPRLAPGPHVLRVRAGGPGMLYQKDPIIRRFRVR